MKALYTTLQRATHSVTSWSTYAQRPYKGILACWDLHVCVNQDCVFLLYDRAL